MMNFNGETSVYGIFGYPVKHSKSPSFQNAAFDFLGLNSVYVPFEVEPEDLEKAVDSLRVLNIKGINVTIPHKERIIQYLDEISDEVRVIGAVNTVKNIDGYLIGYNTDWHGFISGLKEIDGLIEKKNILVIGAGGASRAVLYAFLKEDVPRIYLANKTQERAINLVRDFSCHYKEIEHRIHPIHLDQVGDIIGDVDIVVNTTSVGLKDEDKPLFDYDRLSKDQTVVDIIYKETLLLKKAKEKGCKYQDGYPMLIYQGAKSFEIWTGLKAPIQVMKEAVFYQ